MARPQPVKREERARNHLKLMLHAANAVLVSKQNPNPDYQAEVRDNAAKTRKDLDAVASAHNALINGFRSFA